MLSVAAFVAVVLDSVLVVVFARVVLLARKVVLGGSVSMPEREKAAEEETKGAEVERKID